MLWVVSWMFQSTLPSLALLYQDYWTGSISGNKQWNRESLVKVSSVQGTNWWLWNITCFQYSIFPSKLLPKQPDHYLKRQFLSQKYFINCKFGQLLLRWDFWGTKNMSYDAFTYIPEEWGTVLREQSRISPLVMWSCYVKVERLSTYMYLCMSACVSPVDKYYWQSKEIEWKYIIYIEENKCFEPWSFPKCPRSLNVF